MLTTLTLFRLLARGGSPGLLRHKVKLKVSGTTQNKIVMDNGVDFNDLGLLPKLQGCYSSGHRICRNSMGEKRGLVLRTDGRISLVCKIYKINFYIV